MRPADAMWLKLIVDLITYESQAPKHELLSYALKRYSRKYPWLVRFAVVATALHLLDVLPVWADPWVVLYLIRLGVEKLIVKIRELIESFGDMLPLITTAFAEAAA